MCDGKLHNIWQTVENVTILQNVADDVICDVMNTSNPIEIGDRARNAH